MGRIIDTRVIRNFWSAEEIDRFENAMPKDEKYRYTDTNPKTGQKTAETVNIIFDNKDFEEVSSILLPKLHEHFGKDIIIDSAHILNSYNPYGIHTDVLSGKYDKNNGNTFEFPDAVEPAWTFLIPLGDYDSATIAFLEESAEFKTVFEWAKHHKIRPDQKAIDKETREKYFSHVHPNELDFLHIDQIYNWNKGGLFAASRKKFHTSDNYIANGLTSKRAIIIWTSVPIE